LLFCHDNRSRIDYAPAPSRIAYGAQNRPVEGEIVMPNLDIVVLSPAIALIAGILILLMPRLLNYVIAIYLIVIGLLGLMHHVQ
jgi:hypothetical protein